MKKILMAVIIISFAGILMFLMRNLKGGERTVQARYLMLACERCYHMEVERSTDPAIIGKTIIPRSEKVDIEEMINDALEQDTKLFCLKGRARLLNLSLFSIDPDGIVFFVEETLPIKQCKKL